MENIDDVVLSFSEDSLFILNVVLAFIMFGISLDLKFASFRNVLSKPISLTIGLLCQLGLLPLMTFGLILLFKPLPSMALGMIMVASCPGGNISNFMSSLAGANVELSIVMTVFSSIGALFFTPFNLNLYGMAYAPTREILVAVELDWLKIVSTIMLIIVIPIILGKAISHYFPVRAERIKKPIRNLSMLAFLIIVAFALTNNGVYFRRYIGLVFLLVLVHNASAFSLGFLVSKSFSRPSRDIRSITIETGIQNSGLGLILIFSFFSGLGGMAVVAAWWGIWHIISGFMVSFIFSRI
ncbi:MAG: bile acid:sodium symporter family protein [Saprospiraceae bacterium]|jgi:BASS family bile acid:Na+ symporter